ncbi:MAG: aminoacyl-tRNA hydrolase [Nitrospinae bacterium CG11_big_fil_rev_8_21_14_0_20_56_8]|nr:MAG: aminoacyl-tRNA hydrolase [Nitrospinae bacterium CG11_big_fil_rev_8_21_14_0_20_56_8]
MFLILGLGNPGPRYEFTRHNIGFQVADRLADKHRIGLTRHGHSALYGRGEIGPCPVMVAKPMTYMNASGKAAKALLSALRLSPGQLLVIHDDIDLALGKMKRKSGGGDAGQLGVRSIAECLGTDAFHRFRIGVGRPENRGEIVDFVLSPFAPEDIPVLNETISQAVLSIESALMEISKKSN